MIFQICWVPRNYSPLDYGYPLVNTARFLVLPFWYLVFWPLRANNYIPTCGTRPIEIREDFVFPSRLLDYPFRVTDQL